MTAFALALQQYPAIFDDRSQSEAGAVVREELRALRTEELGTVTLSRRLEPLEALREAVEEAREPGWMGPNSLPADLRAARNALWFLDLLPATFPTPDIAIEPDGEIEIEWYSGPRSVFSVSIGPRRALHFAGLFGRREVHGVEYLAGEIPAQILEYAHRALE